MVDILHRIGVAAAPKTVLDALTRIDRIQSWWDVEAEGGVRTGESFGFRGHRLDVMKADPDGVRWTYRAGPATEWIDSSIVFDIRPRERETVILFRHEGWAEPVEFMHHCSTKWATFLLSLKSLLEGGEGRPKPRDVRIALD